VLSRLSICTFFSVISHILAQWAVILGVARHSHTAWRIWTTINVAFYGIVLVVTVLAVFVHVGPAVLDLPLAGITLGSLGTLIAFFRYGRDVRSWATKLVGMREAR